MTDRSIFYDDWRACLRAHYIYVIRVADVDNETSLYSVLRDTGFSDDEILDMRAESGIVDMIAESALIEEVIPEVEIPAVMETVEPPPTSEPPAITPDPPPRRDNPPARPLVQQSLF